MNRAFLSLTHAPTDLHSAHEPAMATRGKEQKKRKSSDNMAHFGWEKLVLNAAEFCSSRILAAARRHSSCDVDRFGSFLNASWWRNSGEKVKKECDGVRATSRSSQTGWRSKRPWKKRWINEHRRFLNCYFFVIVDIVSPPEIHVFSSRPEQEIPNDHSCKNLVKMTSIDFPVVQAVPRCTATVWPQSKL